MPKNKNAEHRFLILDRCLCDFRHKYTIDDLLEEKREFMYKVGIYGKNMSALTGAMAGCPTVYCGGGSTFHRMRISPRYFSDVRMVGKDTLSIPNLKNRTIPNELYTILATSYGLSVPQIDEPEMVDLSTLFDNIGITYSAGRQSRMKKLDYGLLDD